MKLTIKFTFSLLFVLILAACANNAPIKPANTSIGLTPDDPYAKHVSTQLALTQTVNVSVEAARLPGPKLWFAGFGLHSGSKAFRGDVLLTNNRMRVLNPKTLSLLFDNDPQPLQLVTPFAHLGAFAETIQTIAQHASKNDIVTIMMSTHGAVNILATQIGGQDFANINDHHLKTALLPLKDIPTVLIISACHSGSLIPSLKEKNRIILTAAAEKNVSYGCQPLAQNTFFIDALFGEKFDQKLSLIEGFMSTKERISLREKELKLAPSEPQISIGENMQVLAEKPLNKWFSLNEKQSAEIGRASNH
jgi:hypothetical protein